MTNPQLPAPVPAPDPEPQPVLYQLTTSAEFLVVRSTGTPEADATLLGVASDVNGLVRSVGFRQGRAELSCVVGLGSDFWDRVRPTGAARPAHLHPFTALAGARHTAPSTPGDVLFHLRADRADLTFELARQIMRALGDAVVVEDSTTGFRYFDSRDLLGFVDGTENPTGRAAPEAALVVDEPDFVGGSYVVVQKYVHDLDTWNGLSTEEQEKAIGRTKLDDIELDDDVKPSSSHVALNVIEDEDGEELAILRDNMPFGDAGSGVFGTYYIAYAKDPAVTELMLHRMFIGEPEGNTDRILEVSTALTGSLFFVPSLDLLESLADEEVQQQPESGAVAVES
ncbi:MULTISPECIES: Dyp-type peroxidase [Oerskovia]|uniref:Putative deferrochelatase/peroxidase YfeX n=1 Tax=Oerskovia enterophila TaxID=43678 RepID=A0A163PRE7_9CELL|nr:MULTISPECIES: Dyp-type peroxidase [Oerskovia]KZM33429.1 putative deferrochelatase/peroxidase YfeX [Oerskovia enterophila]